MKESNKVMKGSKEVKLLTEAIADAQLSIKLTKKALAELKQSGFRITPNYPILIEKAFRAMVACGEVLRNFSIHSKYQSLKGAYDGISGSLLKLKEMVDYLKSL